LASITSECEEDHIANYSDASSQNLFAETEDDNQPIGIDYHIDLKELTDGDYKELRGNPDEIFKQLLSTNINAADINSIYDELHGLREDRFFSKLGC